jgi:hypothetical protein
VFVDEGQPMATLVGKLLAIRHGQPTVADTIPRDYLSRLVAAFEGPGWRRGLPPGAAR